MSTILEALKKSEQERKLKKVPTLSTMQAPVEQSVWPFRLLVILLVTLFVLISWVGFSWFVIQNNDEQSASKKIVLNNDTVAAQTRLGDGTESQPVVVNVVSYAGEIAQRFVMINGKMFRQGDFVEPGLKVDEIRPDSVILNRRGQRIERKP
jgi:hypothetical protein